MKIDLLLPFGEGPGWGKGLPPAASSGPEAGENNIKLSPVRVPVSLEAPPPVPDAPSGRVRGARAQRPRTLRPFPRKGAL